MLSFGRQDFRKSTGVGTLIFGNTRSVIKRSLLANIVVGAIQGEIAIRRSAIGGELQGGMPGATVLRICDDIYNLSEARRNSQIRAKW